MLERAFMEDAYSRRNRREARTMEEYDKNLIHAEAKEEKRYRKHVMKENYSKFLIDTKDLLLTESIFYFVNESLPTNCSLDDRKKAESIVYSFVKEEGANKLLMKYETSTELLANIANIVNETYNRIVSETECNSDKCTNFFVKKSSTDDFYTKIRGLGDTQISNQIQSRVQKATEEFIKQQVTDNQRIEDLANTTKEKIGSVKAKTDTTREEIKQEFANAYKSFSDNVRYNRPRGIFEEMVYRISDKAVKNQNILESFYTNEEGKLDVDRIIENATMMYTVLETLNTLKFKTFDCYSIQAIIDNI